MKVPRTARPRSPDRTRAICWRLILPARRMLGWSCVLGAGALAASAQFPGSQDATFTGPSFFSSPGGSTPGTIAAVVALPGGGCVVGGSFQQVGGTPVHQIVWLNADGTVDSNLTAAAGSGFESPVTALVRQGDGKLVVGGLFVTYNGIPANRLVRLNPDGSLDAGFQAQTGRGPSSFVSALALDPAGRILVGGNFTTYSGNRVDAIARLTAGGSLDPSFNRDPAGPGAGGVAALGLDPQGRILVGGNFNFFTDPSSAGASQNTVARLSAVNGARDSSFASPLLGSTPRNLNALASQVSPPDTAAVLAGGSFFDPVVNGTVYLVQFGAAGGAIDENFARALPLLGGPVTALAVQANGKIVAAGTFNGTTSGSLQNPRPAGSLDPNSGLNGIVRLGPDGSVDPTFATTTVDDTGATVPGPLGPTDTASRIALTADAKVLVAALVLPPGATQRVQTLLRLYANELDTSAAQKPTVNPPGPGNALPPAVVGQPYRFQLSATNNPTTYAVTGLPGGLTVSPGGLISGTPINLGAYPLTLSAFKRLVGFGPPLAATLAVILQPPPPLPPPTFHLQATRPVASRRGRRPGVVRVAIGVNDEDLATDTVVGYTVGGTATGGTDYQTLAGQVTVPAGQRRAKIVVEPLKAPGAPNKVTVIINLLPAATGEYGVGAPAAATVKIRKALPP